MLKLLGIGLLVAACGDSPAAVVDGAPDAVVLPVAPECHEHPQGATADYTSAMDFGPVAAGSLAGWDPEGRWFLTGIKVGGVSSFHFARAGAQVIVDRDVENPGTIDDDVVFQRTSQMDDETGLVYSISKRVSNRQPDGSLRADRAVCGDGICTVCQAGLVRATYNGDEGVSNRISLVGELRDPSWGPGFTFNVRVVGTTAYLIRQDGLHIIETADPAHPVELGHFQRNGPGYSNDVKIVETQDKRYAIIADHTVDIVNVTTPSAPVLAAQIPESAHTVFTEVRGGKTYAYFGNYDATCPIYDVTDPAAPQRLGRFTTPGDAVHDLSVDNGIAYLNAWDAGLYVVDYTTPSTPTLVGAWATTPTRTSHSNWTTSVGGRHIALHGEESYGAHLEVVDVDPASPTFMQPIGGYKTRDWVSIHNIMAFGNRGIFTHYQDGVRIVDLSDPSNPSLLGYYNTWDPQAASSRSAFFEGAIGLDVDLARKLIFVADSPRGLLILQDDTR